MSSYSVPLSSLTKEFNLNVLHASSDFDKVRIMVEEVSRPGLPMSGFFDHFEPLRIQVIGNVENDFSTTGITSALAAGFDLLFVMMQRYNRPRIVRLIDRQSR